MKYFPFDVNAYAELAAMAQFFGYSISDLNERERLALIWYLMERNMTVNDKREALGYAPLEDGDIYIRHIAPTGRVDADGDCIEPGAFGV